MGPPAVAVTQALRFNEPHDPMAACQALRRTHRALRPVALQLGKKAWPALPASTCRWRTSERFEVLEAPAAVGQYSHLLSRPWGVVTHPANLPGIGLPIGIWRRLDDAWQVMTGPVTADEKRKWDRLPVNRMYAGKHHVVGVTLTGPQELVRIAHGRMSTLALLPEGFNAPDVSLWDDTVAVIAKEDRLLSC